MAMAGTPTHSQEEGGLLPLTLLLALLLKTHLDQVVQELHRVLHVGFAVRAQPEHGIKHLGEK